MFDMVVHLSNLVQDKTVDHCCMIFYMDPGSNIILFGIVISPTDGSIFLKILIQCIKFIVVSISDIINATCYIDQIMLNSAKAVEWSSIDTKAQHTVSNVFSSTRMTSKATKNLDYLVTH